MEMEETIKTVSDLSLGENGNVKHELMDELECPVCLGFMFDSIIMCIGGHNVCGKCSAKLKECPVCRQKITGTRNKTLEKMASRMVVACRYETAGCPERALATEIRKHQKLCKFRLYSCVLDENNCNWEGQLDQVLPHVQERHHGQLWLEENINFVYSNMQSEKHIFMARILGNELFIIRHHYNVEKPYLFVTVQYLGDPEKAKQFKYTAKIFTIDNTKIAMQRMTTLPVTVKLNKIFDEFNCACWELGFVTNFIQNNELWCRVEISEV